MKIAVRDLLPNPFRHLERYPIDEAKVEALVHSIRDTSFWDNLLARKAPDNAGKKEIAYGHHRLMALKKAGVTEIDIPVRDLDDTTMAKIMAHENMEEWAHSAIIEQETVRAIVEAYGDGRIKLPAVKKGTTRGTIRIAPSFKAGPDGEDSPRGETSYTADTLSKFLGWKESKVEDVLISLAAIEDELVSDETFRDLSTRQAAEVTAQTRRVVKETGKKELARAIGTRLAAGMVKGAGKVLGRDAAGRMRDMQPITIHNARRAADEMMGRQLRKNTPTKMPPIDTFATELVFMIGDTVPTVRMCEKLDAIVKFAEHLGTRERQGLVAALDRAIKRLTTYKNKLEG